MCNKINPELVDRAVGYFDKRGDGNPQHFDILVTQCECQEMYWARTPTGLVWVEAEKSDSRNVDPIDANVFVQEVGNTKLWK